MYSASQVEAATVDCSLLSHATALPCTQKKYCPGPARLSISRKISVTVASDELAAAERRSFVR
jgi:hypothetical protein